MSISLPTPESATGPDGPNTPTIPVTTGAAPGFLAPALLQFLATKAHCLAIWFAADGRVRWANQATRDLIGEPLLAAGRSAILLDFSGTMIAPTPEEPHPKPHMISVATAAGLPETFHVVSSLEAGGELILGERDGLESASLRSELLSANRDLNNLTRELHKKNAELERLNTQKNEFLGIAAHDLRSPIANISSLSELLSEDAAGLLNEEQMLYLDTMKSLSDFMLKLLTDLLDITAIESGKLRLDLSSQDPVTLISRSVAINRAHAARKSIRLLWNPDEQAAPEPILLDEAKMLQVCNNLISNAIKFSPPATDVVVGLTTVTTPTGTYRRLSVQDAGPGISDADKSRLFQPFAKLSNRPTDNEKSTGLGLAIVQKVVVAHGGRVGVENPPAGGAGSNFFVDLPITR